jgi:hypothetical protein
MKRYKLMHLTMTLSLSLNCELRDNGRHATFSLPLAWLTMPVDSWRQLVRRITIVLTLTGIAGRSLAWGVGL